MFKKLSFAVIIGVTLSATPTSGADQASEAINQLAAMIENNNRAECKDEAALKCLGISESTCLSAKSDVLQGCTLPLIKKMAAASGEDLPEMEMDMARCAYDIAVDKYKIDPDKYESCVAESSHDASDAIMQLLRGGR